ncbi:hypothetical protein D3C77_536360 [compost metagenome]
MLKAVARRFIIVKYASFVLIDEHHFAVEYLDLVAFQQAANALGHFFNDTVLEFLGFSEIYLHIFHRNTERIRIFGGLILVSSGNQCFRRNTSTVQAHTAKL